MSMLYWKLEGARNGKYIGGVMVLAIRDDCRVTLSRKGRDIYAGICTENTMVIAVKGLGKYFERRGKEI